MGRGRIDKKRPPLPARNRPPPKRQIPVKNQKEVKKWLLIGLTQGFVPRAGELLADLAKPAAMWLAGYLAGLLASIAAAVVSYWAGS